MAFLYITFIQPFCVYCSYAYGAAHCWRRVWRAAHIKNKNFADNYFLYHGVVNLQSVVLFSWTFLAILRLHLTLLILHNVTNGTLSWLTQSTNLSSYATRQKWRQSVLHYQR